MRLPVRSFLSIVTFVTCASASHGTAPVARIISSEPVEINGIAVPARNFVPVGVGGEVATNSTSALIQFSDGTSVVLQPHSQARIAGKPGNLQVMVLHGSAQYNLTPASRVQIISAKHDGNKVNGDDVQAAMVPVSTASLVDALGYRTAGSSLAATLPSTTMATSGFTSGAFSQGTFEVHAGTGGTTNTQIVTPTGLIINLSPQTNPTTGAVSYTVTSVSVTVTQPNGVQSVVTSTSGSLIGATTSFITPATTSGSTFAIAFTPAGSTTPLTPQQAATSVSTTVQTAITTEVNSGQLQAGTTPPAAAPVQVGQFSSTAP